MANVQHASDASTVWGGLEDDTLIQFASTFLSHNVKLLSVYVHIIEGRDPEVRDKVRKDVLFSYSVWFTFHVLVIENSVRCVSKEARKC